MCTQNRETKQSVLTKITLTADWSQYDKREETKAVIAKETEKLLQEHFNQRSENLVVIKHKKHQTVIVSTLYCGFEKLERETSLWQAAVTFAQYYWHKPLERSSSSFGNEPSGIYKTSAFRVNFVHFVQITKSENTFSLRVQITRRMLVRYKL